VVKDRSAVQRRGPPGAGRLGGLPWPTRALLNGDGSFCSERRKI